MTLAPMKTKGGGSSNPPPPPPARTKTELITTDHIRCENTQVRKEGINQEYLKELVTWLKEGEEQNENRDFDKPIVVFKDRDEEEDIYWLADGYHRLKAFREVLRAEVRAEVRPGKQRDAFVYALGANATHGLQRTNADKRYVVELALKDPDIKSKSLREIATICGGVSPNFVLEVRKSLSSEDKTSKSKTRTKKRGASTTPQPASTTENSTQQNTEEPQEEAKDTVDSNQPEATPPIASPADEQPQSSALAVIHSEPPEQQNNNIVDSTLTNEREEDYWSQFYVGSCRVEIFSDESQEVVDKLVELFKQVVLAQSEKQ